MMNILLVILAIIIFSLFGKSAYNGMTDGDSDLYIRFRFGIIFAFCVVIIAFFIFMLFYRYL